MDCMRARFFVKIRLAYLLHRAAGKPVIPFRYFLIRPLLQASLILFKKDTSGC